MSHYFAIVLVRAGDGPDAVEKLLAPYNENTAYDEGRNDGWWDWYRLGGRWDGKVRGDRRIAECARCQADNGMHHYDDSHEEWVHNSVPVVEMGEVLPFTVVKPDGSFTHRCNWDGPWLDDAAAPSPNYVEKPDAEWQPEVAEIMLAHRDCVAVGVDYHS